MTIDKIGIITDRIRISQTSPTFTGSAFPVYFIIPERKISKDDPVLSKKVKKAPLRNNIDSNDVSNK